MKTRITELFGIEHPIIQGGMHYVGFAEMALGDAVVTEEDEVVRFLEIWSGDGAERLGLDALGS